MDKEIAIIIPVYNAHDTIEHLLFSILNQSVKDICRVYLIDDYSEKDYFYLIDKFPWLDMVICRLDENGGPGVARNKGLELVVEDDIPYIVFADADDCFYNYHSLEILYEQIPKNDFVISAFLEEREDFNFHNNLLHIDVDIWLFGKLYKTKIIKDHSIHFPSNSENEDVAFNVWYKTCSEKILQLEGATYIWKYNANSITRKNNNEYVYYCYTGLCNNLTYVFQKMKEDKNISEDKITIAIINRMIRLYLAYNSYLKSSLSAERMLEFFNAVQFFYNKIYNPIEKKVTYEILENEWDNILIHNGIPFVYLGWDSFIKKIREE